MHTEPIKRLRECVSEKFDFGAPLDWTHHLFEELSEHISKETGVSLSANTLKRFFGKIKTRSGPSKTTLNTLAQFCGFESYYDFVQQEKGEGGLSAHKKVVVVNNEPAKQWVFAFLGFVALIVVVAVYVFFQQQNIMKQGLEDVQFSQAKELGKVPFTQIFKYHVPPSVADSIYFEEYEKGEIGLSTHDSIFSYMHFVPGFRVVTFKANGKLLWGSTYQVNSDGWLLVFPHGGLEPRKYIPLNPQHDFLTIRDEALQENNINPELDGGWLNFFNMQDYGVDGSDFSFETTFKNVLKTGAQQCQDAIVTVECQAFKFSVHFTHFGCQKFAGVQIGDTFYDGIKNDWTALALDMDSWNQISYQVKNGVFKVAGNGKRLLELPFDGQPGSVSGLHFSFRGSGMVKHVAIKNGQGEAVFQEFYQQEKAFSAIF